MDPLQSGSEGPDLRTHSKRPEWGIAVRIENPPGKRVYRFEDGKERTFKEGFYHFLDPVEREPDEAMAIAQKLGYGTPSSASANRGKESKGPVGLSFPDQVRVFLHLYPGGFQGEAYTKGLRGTPDGRRLKKLIEPAINHATLALTQERMDELIADGDFAAIHKSASEVVGGTNMCSPSQDLGPLDAMPEENYEAYAVALRELLYGEGEYGERLEALVETLKVSATQRATWPLVTVMPALLNPTTHLCVKPKVIKKELAIRSPLTDYRSVPNGRVYKGLLALALDLKEALESEELKPRDLLDVARFMSITRSPKAERTIHEL